MRWSRTASGFKPGVSDRFQFQMILSKESSALNVGGLRGQDCVDERPQRDVAHRRPNSIIR